MTNAQISELLALSAEATTGHLVRALRRASSDAITWPVEAVDLWKRGEPLDDLESVGPYLAKIIRNWLEDPPEVPDPPPLRNHFLTLTTAKAILDGKPQWRRSLRGDLQMHTTWSDGAASCLDMARAGEALGYSYLAITDHSKDLTIAGGMDEARLRSQGQEIAKVNKKLEKEKSDLRLLHALEMNLRPDGSGDMDSKALAKLDLVLGSFHSQLRKKDDQTDRYLRALENPDIQILGHPRGRIYNYRMGLTADWPRVFARAAELDKAVEIDGYPDRQDLSGDLIKLAKKAEVRISLGSDSHAPNQLLRIELALASAALAGIPKKRIINFMERDELLAWVASVRSQ